MRPDPRIAALVDDLTSGPADDGVSTLFADAVGALVVGTTTAEGRAVAALGRTLRSAPWGGGLLDDVLVRTAIARLSEVDDIHMATCVTPGSVVVPVALTLRPG